MSLGSPGSVAQIVAKGIADIVLTGLAEVTYWRMRVQTCSNFALECVQEQISNAAFGKSGCRTQISRSGDLIHDQYIKIELPGLIAHIDSATAGVGVAATDAVSLTFPYVSISGGSTAAAAGRQAGMFVGQGTNVASLDQQMGYDTGYLSGFRNIGGEYVHWVQAVGMRLLKKVELRIGNQQVDTLTSDWLFVWEELAGKPGKRCLDAVGKHPTREGLIAFSRCPQTLFVPLPFWYTKAAGNALSAISLQYHSIELVVDFEELKKLVIRSTNAVDVKYVAHPGSGSVNHLDADNRRAMKLALEGAGYADAAITSQSNFSASQAINCYVESNFVFLDSEERDRFAEGQFDQLVTLLQYDTFSKSSGNASTTHTLTFNHPVTELVWFVRRNDNIAQNKHYDFSSQNGDFGTVSHGNVASGTTLTAAVNTAAGGAAGVAGDANRLLAALCPAVRPNSEIAFMELQEDLGAKFLETNTTGLTMAYGSVAGLIAGQSATNDTLDDPGAAAIGRLYMLGEMVACNADPIVSAELKINNMTRFAKREAEYFRNVQCRQHHTNIPSEYIYVYSFALYPEDAQPSGSLNFSRLDTATLTLNYSDVMTAVPAEVVVFAPYWNVFTYDGGVGGLAYAN